MKNFPLSRFSCNIINCAGKKNCCAGCECCSWGRIEQPASNLRPHRMAFTCSYLKICSCTLACCLLFPFFFNVIDNSVMIRQLVWVFLSRTLKFNSATVEVHQKQLRRSRSEIKIYCYNRPKETRVVFFLVFFFFFFFFFF